MPSIPTNFPLCSRCQQGHLLQTSLTCKQTGVGQRWDRVLTCYKTSLSMHFITTGLRSCATVQLVCSHLRCVLLILGDSRMMTNNREWLKVLVKAQHVKTQLVQTQLVKTPESWPAH